VGAGPNGLAAAVTLARAGRSVLLLESNDTIGGGVRSAALTLPGFLHDVCSAIHPLAVASPCFRSLPLAAHGLEWIQPPFPLAHPFDDGTAAILRRSVDATAAGLGDDAQAYRNLMGPFVNASDHLIRDILGTLRSVRHPLLLARFGFYGMRSAQGLVQALFAGEPARGLFAGLAAHAVLPLERRPTAAFGLFLGMLGHAVGWPLPRGGSQHIAAALAGCLRAFKGDIATGAGVASLDALPPARAVLLDLGPRGVLQLAGARLPEPYRSELSRYRYGPGVCKLDLALDGPIPWRNPDCTRAGTVHVGGRFDEIAAAERLVWEGAHPERPFVLLAQQSLFDPTRAPTGKHTVWAYCHVPQGSTVDMSERIEKQIERFAPGFRQRILARSVRTASDLERDNPNLVGGDITGGVQDLRQLLVRPARRRVPYATPVRNLYICSASTPPGGGVHGMCGYHAARAALRALRGREWRR